MKSSKVYNVQTCDVRSHLNRERVYDLYSSRIVKIERDYLASNYGRYRTNVSCQCNIKRDLMYTCGRLASHEPRYFSSPKQVYRYSDWRSFTDIGVGSIKALPRKRIRKVYLPETIDRAVGSADLISYIDRKSRQQWAGSYYENKKTSSKCVGGFIECDNVSLLSKNLSPIIEKKSGTTSPSPNSEHLKVQDINDKAHDVQKHKISFYTQVNMNDFKGNLDQKEGVGSGKIKSNPTLNHTLQEETRVGLSTVVNELKSEVVNENNETCKEYSSDSFVQHVHNLEIPSENKQSKTSVDPMENKLEREYRKIFTTTSKEKPSVDKQIPDFKSASLLRRRFEALRRGLGKKESKKESVLINKITSQASMQSRKDVSIASDPPSLEGRSYSNTELHSPVLSTTKEYKPQPKISNRKTPKNKKVKDSLKWSPELGDSKCESVQGMFKLWGNKFNLDEDKYKTTISNDVSKSPEQLSKSESPPHGELLKKKQGRKFFIFGKKTNKENKQNNYKTKKNVTAVRCEVKDGLTIKVGGANEPDIKEPVKKQATHLEKYEEVLGKGWLDKYITNTRDSRNSVHIRWNNKMYATSSSTILELMDSVYKRTGIDLRSRSEVTTEESSKYNSYTKQRVHFMQQDIEAWMMPKMITNKQYEQIIEDRVSHNRNKCQRWFVDTSKGFSQKIELVLHSKPNTKSSEYVIINIPEGYFPQSSSELRAHSSDEKIYKIVEYDNSDLKKIIEHRHIATSDNFTNSTKNSVGIQNDDKKTDTTSELTETVLEKPSLLRDVAIQGSDVFVPKRCDVIGVGIITQRDIRDVRKPLLKIEDGLSDESVETLSIREKKCELAESYLQEYCRHWMPTGTDMISWRLSDSQLQSSENNSVGSLSQGDGTNSYPSVYDNFPESTIVLSSCETSSCSHCIALEDEKKPDESLKSKFLNKFKKKSSEVQLISDKRNCPKDSLEVYKRRQYYACTNQKRKWFCDEIEIHPSSNYECQKNKPCWRIPGETKNRQRGKEKRVSLPGCEAMSRLVDKLSDRTIEGILSHKGYERKKNDSGSPKRTNVSADRVCDILPPPCKESCEKMMKPPCTKKNAPPCDESLQPQVNPKVAIPPCEIKPISPPRTPPLCIKPVKKSLCSSCNNLRSMSNKCIQQHQKNISKKPSQESRLSLKMSPITSPKVSDSCFPTGLHASNIGMECEPNCGNKKKNINKMVNTPPTPPPTAFHRPQTPKDSANCYKEKATGLYLKKLPSKKRTGYDDCYNSNVSDVIRLNSQENITIRTKKVTPSTEEIRENLNIKVQDEDGQTLYERLDYTNCDTSKCVLIKNMCHDSQIQRVSTPTLVQVTEQKTSQNEMHDVKSDISVDNLIEINFTLKLKQGDKGTDVNIINEGNAEIKHIKEGYTRESQKHINIVEIQNQTEPESAVTGNKNDVNIKIVIKNYTTDADENKCNETETYSLNNAKNDVFSKTISEKFHTVSTCYSGADHHAYSIHRATVDLCAPDDKYAVSTKKSECQCNNELINESKDLKTSQSIACSVTEQTVQSVKCNNEENLPSSQKSSTNIGWIYKESLHEDILRFYDEKSDKCTKNHAINKASNKSFFHKKISLRNKAEKKEMFKKLFRTSSVFKKPENKKKLKEILHAILTSDSSGTEVAVKSNELTKELTYASLEPGIYKNTDSMSNYYGVDSDTPDHEEGKLHRVNTTKDNSEFSENESVPSLLDNERHGCLCSTLAAKLNITLNGDHNRCGCGCTSMDKKDKEIVCDSDSEHCLLNYKASIDVETQYSKHISTKTNSANLSILRQSVCSQSVVIANTSVIIQKSMDGNENSEVNFISSTTMLRSLDDMKDYGIKGLNRETLLRLSDDDMIVFNSNTFKKSLSQYKRKKISKHVDRKSAAPDILQLNETKKAVLEIYAEKIISDEGEKIVAKLPKFHVENEKDISNYEDMVTSRKKISKRNLVMMTVNR